MGNAEYMGTCPEFVVGMSGVPEKTTRALDTMDTALSQIEAALQPLLEKPIDEIKEGLDLAGQAKLDIAMAYSLNSLFYMYLKTQGQDPGDHPVTKEMERVRGYVEKLERHVAMHGKKEETGPGSMKAAKEVVGGGDANEVVPMDGVSPASSSAKPGSKRAADSDDDSDDDSSAPKRQKSKAKSKAKSKKGKSKKGKSKSKKK